MPRRNSAAREKIVIVGAGGQAKVVIDLIECAGRHQIVGLLDAEHPVGDRFAGYEVLGREADLARLAQAHALGGWLVAIGDNYTRAQVTARLAGSCPDLPLVCAVHPQASIARDVPLGPGTVVMAGAVANPGATVGRGCVLNSRSVLEHDSRLGDFASLGPGAITGGRCRIGEQAAICIGAVLVHKISIGANTVIGAGSTVLQDIESGWVAYGSPARPVRRRQPADPYL